MGLAGRRRFLIATSALLAVPAVRAQQTQTVRRIGFLTLGSDFRKRGTPHPYSRAFLRGLAENGFVVGRNLVVEYRFAEGRTERYPALVANLIQQHVEVIFGWGRGPIVAAKATRTIPIVFVGETDAVAFGLVKSLSHPGGNVTGFTNQGLELAPKRLELLKTAVPDARRIAYLVYATHPLYGRQLREVEAAARRLGVQLRVVQLKARDALSDAFLEMKSARFDAVLVEENQFFNTTRREIADLALEDRLPTMCEHAAFTQVGCLMSYGPDFLDVWRRAGVTVARILKGANPSDMPVEQPTKFEFVVNKKTAGALGLTIPQSVLLRADRVIE